MVLQGNKCEITSINTFNAVCSSVDATSLDSPDGSVTILVNGGTPPYSYQWTNPNGATGETIEGLLPGTYTVVVSDEPGDNIVTLECVVGGPVTASKFELCISEDEDDIGQTIYLADLGWDSGTPKVYFQVTGQYVYNIPEVGQYVNIEDLGFKTAQSGLRKCCYQRLSSAENWQWRFLGYFGNDDDTRVVFSEPNNCSSTDERKSNIYNQKLDLFSSDNTKSIDDSITKNPSSTKRLKINKEVLTLVRDYKPDFFRFDLPVLNGKVLELTMEKFKPHKSQLTVGITSGGGFTEQLIKPRVTCYRITDKSGYIGTLTIKKSLLGATLIDEYKQLVLGKVDTKSNDDEFILFDTNDLKDSPPEFACGYDLVKQGEIQQATDSIKRQLKNNFTCTTIAMDISKGLSNDFNGNVSDISDYVTELMAIVTNVYYTESNGQRVLQIGYIHIWDTENNPCDVIATYGSGPSLLSLMEDWRDLWNQDPNLSQIPRNLVHGLIRKSGGSLRGAAWGGDQSPSQVCLSSVQYAFCYVDSNPTSSGYYEGNSYERLPKTICHEIGHNFSSEHTFKCNEWGNAPGDGMLIDEGPPITLSPQRQSNAPNKCPVSNPPRIGYLPDNWSQSDDYVIDPSYNPNYETIMSYGDRLLKFNPRVMNEHILATINTPACVSECFEDSPEVIEGGGVVSFDCNVGANYIDLQTSFNANILNPQNLIEGTVYEFAEFTGQYTYVGEVIVYAGTLVDDVTITNSTGVDCDETIPPPPPPPPQYNLCLSNNVDQQYDFSPGSFGNDGFQHWNNSEYDLKIKHVNDFEWSVVNWDNVGLGELYQYTNSDVPTGYWTNVGVSNPQTWQVTIGECQGIPLTLIANPTPESCVGQGNGSVTLQGGGGQPNYTYAIEGISPWPNYQSVGVFNGLNYGIYTGYVKDNSGNIHSIQFTIPSGSNSVEYILNINQTIQQQQGNFDYVYRNGSFVIGTSTSLPSNTFISFKLEATVIYSYDTTGSVQMISNFTPKKNGYNVAVNETLTTNNVTSYCNTFTKYTKSLKYLSDTITIGTTDNVTGEFNYQLSFNNVSDDCECPTVGDATFSINIVDITISGGNCETVSQNVDPVSSNINAERCEQAPTSTPTKTPTPTVTKTQTPTPSITRTPQSTNPETPTPTPTSISYASCAGEYFFDVVGRQKKLVFDFYVGTGLGTYGIEYDVLNNPKRFKIKYNNVIVADSGYVGADSSIFSYGGAVFYEFNQYTINDSNQVTYSNVSSNEPTFSIIDESLTNFGSNTGILEFEKDSTNPIMRVEIFCNPISDDFTFIIDPICNDNTPTPTKTPTVTPTITLSPSLTPSATYLPPAVPCDFSELSLTKTGLGVFYIPFNVGIGTGEVQITLNAAGIPDRFQIIYGGDIVADSLFIGSDQLLGVYNSAILNTTELQSFYYDYTTDTYLQSSIEYVTFTTDDIADTAPGTRAQGAVGNQINVVPGYPLLDSFGSGEPASAADQDIKLFFIKENESPQSGFIKVYTVGFTSGSNSFFNIDYISCPGDVQQETYKYFSLQSLCDSSDTYITNLVRFTESIGLNTGNYIVLGDVGSTLSPYMITEVTDISEQNIIDYSDFDVFNGPFNTGQEALDSSYGSNNIGCRYRMVSCCTESGASTDYVLGTQINFNFNLNVLPSSVEDSYGSGQFVVSYLNVAAEDKFTVCVYLSSYNSIYDTNNEWANHFLNSGNSTLTCVDISCSQCTKKIKLCGTDTVLNWLFNDQGHDYSIGSFIEQNGGLTDEGFETNCFEIVDPSTPLTNSTIHVGSFYDHSNIDDCSKCSEITVDPCDCINCGDGFELYNGDCSFFTYEPVTLPDNPYSLTNVVSGVYSEFGTRIYSTFSYDGSGTFDTITTTGIWKITEPSGFNEGSGDGPLNRSAIWTDQVVGTTYVPTNDWIGFTRCIEVPETKTYYFGLGADNHFRIKINDITQLDTKSTNYWDNFQQNLFKYWHIYPVELVAGTHVIELCGLNLNSIAGFGCEVYNNTISELINASSPDQLNVIFNSRDASIIDIVEDGATGELLGTGYSCPSGYFFSPCLNQCITIIYCNPCPQT